MTRQLPARPDLEHLKKQAKALLRRLVEGDPVTRERYRALLAEPVPEHPKLADAQRALALDHGFASWPKLRAHVVALDTDAEADPVAALVAAVKTSDVAGARRVLERHPELRARLDDALPGFAFDGTALIAAVAAGSCDLVDLLLAAGAHIDQKTHWWAGGFGVLDTNRDLAPYLIARGATVDAHAAARLGMLDRLEALAAADSGVVHARGGDGQTPLHVAANVEIATWLLDHGAEIDARDVDHESTPAQYLVRERPEVTRLLVERGAACDILMAAALGDEARVERELETNPESIRTCVDERWFPRRNPHSGGTIYIWTLGANKTAHTVAREFGHEGVLQRLLAHTPDPLRLALAGELGDEVAFRRLLDARPDLVPSLDEDDRRKLVFAAQNNNTAAVKLMADAGWPLETRGQHGGTALHWACWHGNLEMVRALLSRHPALELQDQDHGQTPLGWALHGSLNGWHRATGDYPATVAALLAAGATAPAPDPEQAMSPAVHAVLARHAGGPRDAV